MSFSIQECEDLDVQLTGRWWQVQDDSSREPDDRIWAFCGTEQDAFLVATAMNIMSARNEHGTPWSVLVDVQMTLINEMVHNIIDSVLSSSPFGLINRQCKYCGAIWGVGSALLPKAGIDDEIRRAPKETTHKPTCLFSVMGEWKIAAADRLNEAIRRSKHHQT